MNDVASTAAAPTAHYRRMTARAALQLMAPHTWVAAIAPVAVGGALTIGLGDFTPLTLLGDWRAVTVWVLMLACAILAQSAVNTMNDYQDFKAGTDTAENCVDTTDAALIYHHLNPRSARTLALSCAAGAGVAGITVTLLSSPVILFMGLAGVAALFLYSAGPKSISYLPLGELVSGLAMGGIITTATYLAMTGHLSWLAAVGALPPIITIALIMQVNNTADIERDIEAGRRTLPILLGTRRSASMIVVLQLLTLVFCAAYTGAYMPVGTLLIVVASVSSVGRMRILWNGPYNAANRPVVMKAIVIQAAVVNAAFVAAILLGAHFHQ